MQQQPDGRSLSKTQLNFKESVEIKELEALSVGNTLKNIAMKKRTGSERFKPLSVNVAES